MDASGDMRIRTLLAIQGRLLRPFINDSYGNRHAGRTHGPLVSPWTL